MRKAITSTILLVAALVSAALVVAAATPPEAKEYEWKDGSLPKPEAHRRRRGAAPNETDYANGHARVSDAWMDWLVTGDVQ